MGSQKENIQDAVDKCTFCGSCRKVCPVFKLKGKEIYSTRGRINLVNGLLQEELNSDEETRSYIDACLDCRQCIDICPADVEFTRILFFARSELYGKKNNFRLLKYITAKLFSSELLTSEKYFQRLSKIVRLIYNKEILNFSGKILFKILKVDRTALYSKLPDKNFFKMGIRNRRNKTIKGNEGIRVSIFLGCGGKFLYPETADRYVKLLRSNGIHVVIPLEQLCCGYPLKYHGLKKNALENMKLNISVFNEMIDIKYVTGLCSNSLSELRDHGFDITGRNGFRQEIKNPLEVLESLKIKTEPFHHKDILFHSCPKCSDNNFYKEFISTLYSKSDFQPVFDTEFCGATVLFDKKNLKERYEITRQFMNRELVKNIRFIACSSFECVEYLNSYLHHIGSDITAIHFLDSLKV